MLPTLPERIALARRDSLDYVAFLEVILSDLSSPIWMPPRRQASSDPPERKAETFDPRLLLPGCGRLTVGVPDIRATLPSALNRTPSISRWSSNHPRGIRTTPPPCHGPCAGGGYRALMAQHRTGYRQQVKTGYSVRFARGCDQLLRAQRVVAQPALAIVLDGRTRSWSGRPSARTVVRRHLLHPG